MARVVKIKGMDRVLANLNKAIVMIENHSVEGLIHSAILIRRETETKYPKTPVDLGNLRASWFVVASRGKGVRDGKSASFKGKAGIQIASDHAVSISAAQVVAKKTPQPMVIMGYSANYAAAVHEMQGASFQRENAGPKWLETHLKNNTKEIVKIVKQYTRVP